MDRTFFEALIPVLGLACNVVFQITWLRATARKALLDSIYVGFIAGGMAVCLAQISVRGGTGPSVFAGDILANLVTYSLLGYCYFHFINLGETGRRARLLRELYECPEGLTLEKLLSRYDSKQMLALRLTRLVNNRQVIQEDDRFRLGRPTMARIGGAILFLKKAILGRNSEFE